MKDDHIPSILVADDDPQIRKLLKTLVESFGYRAVTAGSGEETLEVVVREKPDILLLDIHMPGLDGYTVAGRISNSVDSGRPLIVIISGANEELNRVRALKVGASDFLAKPIPTDILRVRLESLLKVKAYNDFQHDYQIQLETVLKNQSRRLLALVEAYCRFVPAEFIQQLNKKDIVDVKLGDQVLKNMAVLFSDIRSFTTLSEKMTPQQTFNFLNSYLKRMDPLVWSNDGFIDKYIGDAIMALYPNGAESALKSGIDMIAYLPVYNEHRRSCGYDPISIGIGIHVGEVMLGTIGHDRFMQGTVISNAVNLTAHLEALTKIYGAALIVSSDVVFALQDPTRYSFRFLDQVELKGMVEPVSVFEVLDGAPLAASDLKSATKETFERAVNEFHQNRIPGAARLFAEIPDPGGLDGALAVYKRRCAEALSGAVRPEDIPATHHMGA
jgi:two-component system sensor histidine kinase ChiS